MRCGRVRRRAMGRPTLDHGLSAWASVRADAALRCRRRCLRALCRSVGVADEAARGGGSQALTARVRCCSARRALAEATMAHRQSKEFWGGVHELPRPAWGVVSPLGLSVARQSKGWVPTTGGHEPLYLWSVAS